MAFGVREYVLARTQPEVDMETAERRDHDYRQQAEHQTGGNGARAHRPGPVSAT